MIISSCVKYFGYFQPDTGFWGCDISSWPNGSQTKFQICNRSCLIIISCSYPRKKHQVVSCVSFSHIRSHIVSLTQIGHPYLYPTHHPHHQWVKLSHVLDFFIQIHVMSLTQIGHPYLFPTHHQWGRLLCKMGRSSPKVRDGYTEVTDHKAFRWQVKITQVKVQYHR